MKRPEQITRKYLNWLQYQVIGAAIEVHRHLGPDLLEKVYEKALIHELQLKGFQVASQKTIRIPLPH